MKRILFALTLAAITFPLTSNTAYADTPETSSEVQGKRFSHINGMPIKVGEHNEYYYDHKRFNISANPIGPILAISVFLEALLFQIVLPFEVN